MIRVADFVIERQRIFEFPFPFVSVAGDRRGSAANPVCQEEVFSHRPAGTSQAGGAGAMLLLPKYDENGS
jgi:hypothetical protein